MVIKCPRCQIALTGMEYQPGTTVHWCGLCSGIWVDGEELYEILKVSPDTMPEPTCRDAGACPKCGNRFFYPLNFPDTDVVVDICEGCKGIWFDRGELQAIKASGRGQMADGTTETQTASEKMASWVNSIIDSLKSM